MRYALPFLCCFAAFLLVTTRSEAGDARDIRALVSKIQAAADADDPDVFESAVGAAALRSVPATRRQDHLVEMRTAFRGVRIGDVEVEKQRATVELVRTGRIEGKAQLTLMRDGGTWRLSSPHVYPVEGAALDTRRGSKPVDVRLELRTESGPYGRSAYSFRYATADAKAAKNRVDIWVCHNDEIHAHRNDRIVDLGRKKLSAVTSIPCRADWGRTAAIKAGHVYVVHCRDERDRDFYAKMRVTSFDSGVVELEWTLLTGGFGAPDDIHTPTAVSGKAGADGTDGLCGRHG